MYFEFDPAKSAANAEKHGIDFIAAQALWLDIDRIEAPSWIVAEEARWVVVGRIGDRLWTSVVTYRGDNIRIISVRKARDNESENYHSRGI